MPRLEAHANYQVFAASIGLDEPWANRGESPISYSFCQHVVTSGDALVVIDARLDERVSSNPAVSELGVLAYAGMPLITAAGQPLAAAAMTEIELRQTVAALDQALTSVRTLKALIPVCSRCSKIRDDEGFWNTLVKYVSRQSGAKISHGICPDCEGKFEADNQEG